MGQIRLLLVQHGIAADPADDPQRPLTEEGCEATARVATWAAFNKIRVDRVLHSGKLRAFQTAEIFALHLHHRDGPIETAGIGPNDDVEAFARNLSDEKVTMVVGHLPFLSRLAGVLVSGDAEQTPVSFRNSGLVCLAPGEDGWSVEWITVPELVSFPR